MNDTLYHDHANIIRGFSSSWLGVFVGSEVIPNLQENES